MRGKTKNTWVLVLFMLAGVVLGGFIGELCSGISALSWLAYGSTFGLPSPLVLDLGIIAVQFGLTIRFTIAGIFGIVLAFILYRKM